MTREYKTCANGASAIAVPGWPLFARWGASMARPRMTLIHSCSSSASAMDARLCTESRRTGCGQPIGEGDLETNRVSVSRTVAIFMRAMSAITHQPGSTWRRPSGKTAEVGAA